MYESFRERSRKTYIVPPPLERMKTFVAQGEAGLVAKILMHEPKAMVLSDAEKRVRVTQALQVRLETAQNPTVTKAAKRKINAIKNGQKEGKALKRQFEQMFSDARVK